MGRPTGEPPDFVVRLLRYWALEKKPPYSPPKLSPGASPWDLIEFEARCGVTLPADFAAFVSAVNGMPSDESDDWMTSWWGLDRMRPIREHYSHVATHPDAHRDFVVCDIMIDSFWYAIRLCSEGSDRGLMVMWGGREGPVIVARSFTDFVEAYLADSGCLPSGMPAI